MRWMNMKYWRAYLSISVVRAHGLRYMPPVSASLRKARSRESWARRTGVQARRSYLCGHGVYVQEDVPGNGSW